VINKYFKENGFTFTPVMGRPGDGKEYTMISEYGVMAYPTNYLVDANGRVVWRAVGFNEKGMRDALAKLGFK
ncbi:MAG TPA: hypothetical protein VM328_02060, partial [Fimbriimonadaceae bacterium]|nr:hypothetical protein [Fimbriimonadaceae bacterium]